MVEAGNVDMECVITLLTEIAKMAIHDYKNYAARYNRLRAEMPDSATKECKLFRIKRNTDKIETFFVEDYYGVFKERGINFVEKLRKECNYTPRERISYEQYCTLLPQEAREGQVNPNGIKRVVTINKNKVL